MRLDAKMEMLRDAYSQANEIAPGIFDRVFPLPTPPEEAILEEEN